MFDKQFIRKEIRTKRKSISDTESLSLGVLLLGNLLPILQNKKNVAIYHAYNGEISLKPTIKYLLDCNINIYQPIAINENRILRFEQILSSDDSPIFVAEDYKIANEIECYNLDLVIMPLVAVDKLGNRIGQGGGYYDSTFATRHADMIFCGVGYEWQVFDQLPAEVHDVKLDFFVSNIQRLDFK